MQGVMHLGDSLRYSRGPNFDFHYSLVRASEAMLAAGTVDALDRGGPVAVWESHVAHVNVRVNDQMFQLVDGESVQVDPYYVFLARTSPVVRPLGPGPRAVHSFGRTDVLARELIIDAADRLTAPDVRVL